METIVLQTTAKPITLAYQRVRKWGSGRNANQTLMFPGDWRCTYVVIGGIGIMVHMEAVDGSDDA